MDKKFRGTRGTFRETTFLQIQCKTVLTCRSFRNFENSSKRVVLLRKPIFRSAIGHNFGVSVRRQFEGGFAMSMARVSCVSPM